MLHFVRRLFGAPAPQGESSQDVSDDRDHNPVVAAKTVEGGPNVSASAHEGELARPDYEAFCRDFCYRPGAKFMESLPAEGGTQLAAWLHWSTPEAEPKAFIRLMLDL